MIFWIIFLTSISFILFTYNRTITKHRIYLFVISASIIIYFSAFRDGLGMDYQAYADQCVKFRDISEEKFYMSEPLQIYLTNYIYHSNFSPIFYFVITSIIIDGLTLWVYFKTSDYSISAFFFVFFPALYIMTFNTVRQFVVGSIFLFISYIVLIKFQKKRTILLYIIIAVTLSLILIHKSAIILLPILIISRKAINPIIASIILALTFIIPLSSIPGVATIMNIAELLDYGLYTDYDSVVIERFSLTNIYLNVIVIIIMIRLYKHFDNPSKIGINHSQTEFYKFAYMMVFYCMIAYNLCANGFTIMYRMSCYFIMFLPILIAILPKIINKYIAYSMIVIPTLILLSVRFINGDEYLIPTKVLSITSIFK